MSNAQRRRERKAALKTQRLGATPEVRFKREVWRLVLDTLRGKSGSTRQERRR